MYRVVKTDGTELGITEAPHYIKIHTNGCFIGASKDDAIGVAFQTVAYNLFGHNDIVGADTVILSEIDGGDEVHRSKTAIVDTDKMTVDLDYRLTLLELGVPEE